MEMTNLVNNFKINAMQVTTLPNGKYHFVGAVPAHAAYVDATAQQLKLASMGAPRTKNNAHLFPAARVFDTYEEAVEFASDNGYKVG